MLGHGDVRFFDLIAPLYDVFMPPVRPEDLRAGLAFAHRPVERAVDLGGGTGRASRTLAELGVDATVVDFSAGMLRRARADGVPGVRADAAQLPLRDDAVDAVVVTDALHHFPDVPGTLQEVARVLAPGGVLVVREFDPTTRRGAALVGVESLAQMDSRFFGPRELAGMVAEVGLRGHVVAPGFGYTVVGVKPTDAAAVGDGADAGDTASGTPEA
ncbi:class I SAM-dependent methyltransferase [Halobaculum marinum]|uniref:Class I SAM-dependent methyltransferase n=1 Tax=Halobaculum marinum TaxID=3031996 RepID=A0ABD5WSR4_9EURY|nr:class I SAM-dependent methyltransferase [Halobaculum sp. DT55]